MNDPKYLRFTSRDQWLLNLTPPPVQEPKSNYTFPILAEEVAYVLRHGGNAAIGEHGEQPGIGSHWEIWTYSEALKPKEALRMATMGDARFFGLDHQIGSVEVGKLADLVVLDGDPLKDIRATANVRFVVKAGVLYDAAPLNRLWPTMRPYGAVPGAATRALGGHHD